MAIWHAANWIIAILLPFEGFHVQNLTSRSFVPFYVSGFKLSST
jgi:hypothetical protein